MAETSYIIQNGKMMYVKDASARKSIGSCGNLKTETKHCLVDAINELNDKVGGGGGVPSDIQEQLDGKAPYGLIAATLGASTDEEILTDLDEVIAGMADNTVKFVKMTGGPNTFLGGFVALMEVVRVNANYCTVKASTYTRGSGGSVAEYVNSKFGGAWQTWYRIYNKGYRPTLADLGLTATADELNSLDGISGNVQEQLDAKTDNKVTQTRSTSTIYRSLLLHNQQGSAGADPGEVTGKAYYHESIQACPAEGKLKAKTFEGALKGNADTATTLETPRTIALSSGAVGTATAFDGSKDITIPVTSVKESFLSWGGGSLSGMVSPIDAACSSSHSANRFAFAKPAGITIEYSTDGSTYSTYDTTDEKKIRLVSGISTSFYIGGRSTNTTINDKLRITLNAANMGLYTRLRKILINISTNYAKGSNVIVEKSMSGSEATFTTIGTYSISGWSGWNSIPVSGGFGTTSGNVASIRLTFGITSVNANYTTNALTVMDIVGIGDTCWTHPSTMAKTGHMYIYDAFKNTTFPADLTAKTIAGVTPTEIGYLDGATGNIQEQLGNKLPTTGGIITGPLDFSGGDRTTSGKIVLNPANSSQITDNGTATLFGFTGKGTSNLTVGNSAYNLVMRGKASRPTYNAAHMAMLSDLEEATADIQQQIDVIKETQTSGAEAMTEATIRAICT